MTLYFCLDDRNGIGYNRRRQSRDSAVLGDIQSRLDGDLMIDPISRRLVERAGIPWCPAPQELPEELPEGSYFVEERQPGTWVAKAQCVVLYRWNRLYPADRWFDIDLNAMGFTLAETLDFAGTSHPIITREVYVK